MKRIKKAISARAMQKRYERNTAKASKKWKAKTKENAMEYARAMAKFGAPIQQTMKNYRKGIGGTSSSDFERSIKGKGAKWARKLKEAVC